MSIAFIRLLPLWVFVGGLLVLYACDLHRPLECEQIRTTSYDPGVITTTLRLSPQPSIYDVVRCFGKPDAYHITALDSEKPEFVLSTISPEKPGIMLSMFYPQRGLTFSHISYDEDPSFSQSSLMTDVTIILPRTITGTINAEFINPEGVLTEIRPWPDTFDKLKLDKK